MNLIYKTLVGSHAYGTNIETSDLDYKGIYIQPQDEILGFKYREQKEVGKDETYYEVRRFLQLAGSANPTILEMLFMPQDEKFISVSSDAWKLIHQNRKLFLTKKCKNSFGGYAVQQIKRAKGLDKKMNYEKDRIERKTVLDFCFVHDEGKSVPVEKWLTRNGLKQQYCGLVCLAHMPDCYALYYDHIQQHFDDFGHGGRNATGHGYHGIVGEDSNSVRTSSVPKYTLPLTVMSFNIEGYQLHCKEYREYQGWLESRNTQRYVDVGNHGQQIDGKNLMHCRRLIDTGIEIATQGDLIVKRPNTEYLLAIRRGEVPLGDIIKQAEEDLARMDDLYKDCDLPEDVDLDFNHDLLVSVRKLYYDI